MDFGTSGPNFLLERFTGLSQMGGRFDTIAVIIVLILHIQIRHLRGLDTYILFADLKWAFHTADQEALLVTCYLAGIVEAEWLLLFDFFLMESTFIQLNGVLSAALKLRAGVPQGRKFAVQSFTSLMFFLQHLLCTTGPSAQSILPSFAADVVSGLCTHLTPKALQSDLNSLLLWLLASYCRHW